MNPRSSINKTVRFMAVVITMITLTACQKARMSSVEKKVQPQYTGIGPQPLPPGGPRPVNPPPGVFIPPGPTTPPGTTPGTPQPAVPPRATPPAEVPPAPTPVATQPTPPVVTDVSEPTVTPLPPRTTPPANVVTPTQNVPVTTAPVYTTTPANSGANYISVPGAGQRGVIQVGGATPAIVATNPMAGDVPVILGNVRVQTPVASTILSTCHGPKCEDYGVVFSQECPAGQDCTKEVKTEKPVLSCPAWQLRTRPYTNKLDVLFVVDTSASMGAERQEIARQMTKFIAELSFDVDYRIAVMLGHGPRSKTSVVGELFTPPSLASDYGVIRMDSILAAKRSQLSATVRAENGRPNGLTGDALEKAAREEAANMVAQRLAETMRQVPNDTSDAQGEAGLLNLYTAVSDSRKLAEMKRREFWRDDSAKTVVFVADENDVCFDYEEASRVAGHAITGHYATEADRKAERSAFEAQDVCRSTAGGQRLTPKHVFEAVEKSSSMPVMFTGILYLDNKNIPAKKNDKYAKDNEMGHGYLDVIGLGLGKAVDLAQANFGVALAKIGDYSNFKMKYDHVFPMTNVKDVKDIDGQSIEVLIQDPSGQKHLFNATHVKLEVDIAENRARVVISYEVLAQYYANGKISEGAKILINYKTKSGVSGTAADATANAPAAKLSAEQATTDSERAAYQAKEDAQVAQKTSAADAAVAAAAAERARQDEIRKGAEELRKSYVNP